MSEQDNLLQADGKPEEQSTENTENTVVNTETDSTEDHENRDEVIDEIEASNAEDAEDEGTQERHEIEVKDYHKMDLEALVVELEKLVKYEKVQAIKKHVEDIRTEFKTKFNTLLEEKKEEFLNEGGNEIDFHYASPIQKKFKDIYRDFRDKLNAHYKSIEQNHQKNLAERLDIIEEIKGLINVEENINTTYNYFKKLQERWKNAGAIPRDKYNTVWNNYHHNVEVFYDYLHLNRDLRDLDFKHNLEQKQKIVERAEELAKDDNLNRAFRELQVLHKIWKEDLGPVAKEHRDEIWNKFKAATKIIHDKRQEYFKDLDKIYVLNLKTKQAIISKIEAISKQTPKSHSAWQNKIKEVDALRNEFFSAGKVPIKVNEATWTKFKVVVREFNRNKNAFYKNLKKDQQENLDKKLELIKIAEANKDSDDFETTTPLMKKIQSEWKEIGHVPRKDSDKIWKQFKSACNHYFDKFHATKEAENKEGFEVYNKKKELLETMKSLEMSGDKDKDLKLIKVHIKQWKDLGTVPSNKRYIEGKFSKTLDALFDNLKMDKKEAEMIKFENKLESLSNANNSRFLDNEHSFIRKKIDEIKGEINQLENNLQFFTNVNDDNPLVKEVHKNIKNHKEDLALWKTKLSKIKELY
ncbi:DUF349 domain-containing protein [Oceanihabitans sediminis]|uniref:DUF349 domain-containing protein n=1 Tax=Oceanihabitans sediminis TaxID=1812012 RepID=A0A368P304_9FLAO|nr:DUF349 domain-containing protein [Oceanihabitans sediminis]MDX1277983.1 DUF349 domain-containing protein [Oceanihabitans sediminis]MDX1774108.1 DUF349 domain-containing protein [Oceanihabitans sediminis]RBP30851.1 uncharacterized protein DUF349 [Oceanihabitans sediminis]RCU56816.1 DUF349 domain-containing protein [Oceanihabitans sediminis]